MRYEREVVRRAFSKWGVRNGPLWYFREGTVVEVGAEKPPFVYLEREDGGLVADLKETVMELAALRKSHRVLVEGCSGIPPLYVKLDIPEDEPEVRVAGVWLLAKVRGKSRMAYTISGLCDLAADYIRQKITGDDLLDSIGRHFPHHPWVSSYLKQCQQECR